MENEIDANLIIQTKNLFNSAGWADFESKVMEQAKYAQANVDMLVDGTKVINQEKLCEINRLAGIKHGVLLMLCIKEEMLDEVDPEREQKVEQTDFKVKEPE